MAKTREQKKAMLEAIQKHLGEAKAVVIATITNLNIKDQQDLRKELRAAGVRLGVVKKTLLKKALEAKGYESVSLDGWSGTIAAAMSATDEVAPARLMVKASKAFEGIMVQYGILEGTVVGVEAVRNLASLPSREELIAKVVGSISAPLYGFMRVLEGNQRALVTVLHQIKQSK